MADIQYNYNPGGATLTTAAPGSAGGGGLPDMTALLRWAAEKEAQKQAFARQQAMAESGRADLATLSSISDAATRRAQITNPAPGPGPAPEEPYFAKLYGNAGSPIGYRGAEFGTPGAVASGYAPAGMIAHGAAAASGGGGGGGGGRGAGDEPLSAGEDLDKSNAAEAERRRKSSQEADAENDKYQRRVWDLRHGV